MEGHVLGGNAALQLQFKSSCTPPRGATWFREVQKGQEKVAGTLTRFQTQSPAALRVIARKTTLMICSVLKSSPYKDQIEELLIVMASFCIFPHTGTKILSFHIQYMAVI